MFETPRRSNTRIQLCLFASFLVHCLVVYLWLNRPPAFVEPSAIAWGRQGSSEKVIYFPRAMERETSTRKIHFQKQSKDKLRPQPLKNSVEPADAGSPEGSLFKGPVAGTEAKPALPMVFPDPEVYPWQLPNGLHGDVIVEVTIDQRGNVTNTRVLQSLQPEIDGKVIATLKNWHFKPATIDGIAISSRQDVHFHFPS
jgi:TonB family protein